MSRVSAAVRKFFFALLPAVKTNAFFFRLAPTERVPANPPYPVAETRILIAPADGIVRTPVRLVAFLTDEN